MPILTVTEKERMSKSVQWVGEWTQKGYLANDMALDNGWLGIANKVTEDKLAPQKTGNPLFMFGGTLTENFETAKQIIYGTRYLFSSSGYLTRCRIKTTIGYQYSVFLVDDPNGTAVVSEILSFIGAVDGWTELRVKNKVITSGVEFDLMARVSTNDLTPAVFNGSWDYLTPKDSIAPNNGIVVHADNQSEKLLINKIDNNASDRSIELLALVNGDKININDVCWTIQSVINSGDYVTVSVVPATQSSTEGIKDFIFSIITATSIAFDKEVEYYLNNLNARGMYIKDDVYENITPSDDAYGVDIEIQKANISNDWDIISSTQIETTASNKYYGFTREVDLLNISEIFTSIGTFEKNIPNGSYVISYNITYTLNSTTNSFVHRFSLNGGKWEEFQRESKDTDDRYTINYFFPIKVTSGSLKFELEARKLSSNNTLNIQNLNIIIDQKV